MTADQANTVRAMRGRSSLEIARALGVSPATALRWCRRLSVQTIGKGNRRPGILRCNPAAMRARSVFELRP
jgi:hypothetical protein